MLQSGSLFHERLSPKWLTFILAFTPNRIYDAAYYKKPIIASKGSFCGKIVSKYDMGFEVDFNEPDFYSHLISYINNFNLIRFERGCNKFIEKIMEQQNSALNLIDKFI